MRQPPDEELGNALLAKLTAEQRTLVWWWWPNRVPRNEGWVVHQEHVFNETAGGMCLECLMVLARAKEER